MAHQGVVAVAVAHEQRLVTSHICSTQHRSARLLPCALTALLHFPTLRAACLRQVGQEHYQWCPFPASHLPPISLTPLSSPLLIRMEPTSVMSRTGGWVASVCPVVSLPITHPSPVPSWRAPAGPPAAAGSARRRSARRGPDRPKKKESEGGAVSGVQATAGRAEISTNRVSREGTQL